MQCVGVTLFNEEIIQTPDRMIILIEQMKQTGSERWNQWFMVT